MRGHIRNYQLNSGEKRWAAVVYRGKRVAKDGKLLDAYRWIRGFHTQKAAQNELNKVLRSIDEGTYAEASRQTLSEYLERWLNTVKPNLEAKTFERYKEIVDLNIVPRLGAIQLAKLQPVQIAEFYVWSATHGNKRNNSGLSARTVLHIHRLLRKALQQAMIWQIRPTNPAAMVEAPRPRDKEIKAVEEDRAAWLIEAAENTDLYLPILFGLCTGMRRGEILGLRWSDLDLDNSRLTVNQSLEQTRAGIHFKSTKNKKSRRTIALPPTLISAIKEHRISQDKNKELFGSDYPNLDLVCPLPDGNPWPPDRFTDDYIAFTRRVVARDIRFHDLRHTHASELLRRGTPIKTVSQRLGHANPTVTLNVYAHMMSGDDENAAQLVEDLLQKQFAKKEKKGEE
jgi:integrase